MIDWDRLSPSERALRVTAALTMAVKLIERLDAGDALGAAVCGLAAAALLGLDTEEMTAVARALESYG